MRKNHCPRHESYSKDCFNCDEHKTIHDLQSENSELKKRIAELVDAIQKHAEGGNIECYGYLSDKIEVILKGGADE